jgi:hypothetical protein
MSLNSKILELFPALHCIFMAEPQPKDALRSGLETHYSSHYFRHKIMINKKVNTVQEALQEEDGMTIMLGGFGLCGIPENAIAELVPKELLTLTCISNNAE